MRKTYTIHSESERWYKAGTQDNAPNLMPIRGGNLDYDKPTQGIKYFRNTIKCYICSPKTSETI